MSAMNRYNLPNWLRWILFFPASIVALAVAYPIVIIGNMLLPFTGQSFLGQLFAILMAAGVSGFAFVWTGAKTAPRNQLLVAIILLAIYSLFMGAAIFAKVSLPHVVSTTWLEIFAMVIPGSVGAILSCLSFKEVEEMQPSQA